MKRLLMLSSFLFASVLFAGPDPRGILELEGYGNSDAAGITSKRGRNDFTIKETLASGDNLFFIKGYGYNGTSFGTNAAASIEFSANQAWTSTANGSKIIFKTTPDGSVTPATAMTIDDDGNVAVTGTMATTGATTLSSATVTNRLLVGSGTGISTITATAATIGVDMSLGGTTPLLTIGDTGEEDTAVLFDGNAQDYHIGLDDSADALVIGRGSALGTTSALSIGTNDRVVLSTNVYGVTNNGQTLYHVVIATSLPDTEQLQITQMNGKLGGGSLIAIGHASAAQFGFTAAGAVTLADHTNCATADDNDTTLNIFDSGTTITIENQLGATYTLLLDIWYVN